MGSCMCITSTMLLYFEFVDYGKGKIVCFVWDFPIKSIIMICFSMKFNEIVINKKIANPGLLQIFRISLFLVIGSDFLAIQCIYSNTLEKK